MKETSDLIWVVCYKLTTIQLSLIIESELC